MTNASETEGLLALPPGTRELGDGLFAGRTDLRRVLLPEGLERLGTEAFAGCERLEEVVLPATLRATGAAAFSECGRLRRVTLPEGLEAIDPGAFLNCAALRTLRFPATLRRVGELAFWGAGLERAELPEKLEEIGECAFWECAALRCVNLPSPTAQIATDAFGACEALREGFIAPGYPQTADGPAELLFTLLWCSCPERHGAAVTARAEAFVRRNEALVMERIIKTNNTAALTGLLRRGLPGRARLDGYVRAAQQRGARELTALLLSGGAGGGEELAL